MRTFAAALLCAALLIVVAGCGSSDDASTSATTATPTTAARSTTTTASAATSAKAGKAAHARFVAKANAVCADFNRELARAQAQIKAVGKSGNVDVYAPAVRRAKRAAERASRRYNALKPPAAETAQAAVIGRGIQAQVTGNDLLLKAALADDPQQFGVAQQALAQVMPQIQAVMRGFGMKACGVAS